MIFLKTDTFCPADNLACEEYYFKESREDVFMLWQNDPVVVIGKNQNLYDEVDLDFAHKENIAVIRRITGGGAVYHDRGNLNYTFITSREKASSLDFAYFTRPILDALSSMGLSASLSGRNDLLLGEEKFSGNAQHADSLRILHHGTLLFSSDLSVLSAVLKPAPEKLRTKKISSVRSRVTNLCDHLPAEKQNISWFINELESFVCRYFSCKPQKADLAAVRRSPYFEKYTQESWIFGRKKEYAFKKSARYPFGTLVTCFDVTDGRLSSLAFEGDFFSLQDLSALEQGLLQTPFTLSALTKRLREVSPGDFFPSLTEEALAKQFLF